jgi:hypothetical protein
MIARAIAGLSAIHEVSVLSTGPLHNRALWPDSKGPFGVEVKEPECGPGKGVPMDK